MLNQRRPETQRQRCRWCGAPPPATAQDLPSCLLAVSLYPHHLHDVGIILDRSEGASARPGSPFIHLRSFGRPQDGLADWLARLIWYRQPLAMICLNETIGPVVVRNVKCKKGRLGGGSLHIAKGPKVNTPRTGSPGNSGGSSPAMTAEVAKGRRRRYSGTRR